MKESLLGKYSRTLTLAFGLAVAGSVIGCNTATEELIQATPPVDAGFLDVGFPDSGEPQGCRHSTRAHVVMTIADALGLNEQCREHPENNPAFGCKDIADPKTSCTWNAVQKIGGILDLQDEHCDPNEVATRAEAVEKAVAVTRQGAPTTEFICEQNPGHVDFEDLPDPNDATQVAIAACLGILQRTGPKFHPDRPACETFTEEIISLAAALKD